MTNGRSQVRLIELLDELAGSGRTDYTADILGYTARTPQRPAWRFPVRWLPETLVTKSVWRVTSPPARALLLLVILGLLVGVTLGALAASRPRLPAPYGPADNGSIAWAHNGEIFAADSSESDGRVLVTGPESDNIPIWSPLGDRLAFLRHPDPTGTVGDFYLMVADADGSNARQLGGPLAGLNGIAWSPDQSTIAFGHSIDSVSAIVLYPVDGGPARTLEVGMPAEWPAWRPPDGRQIAFLGLVDGQWMLHVANADGSSVRNLGAAASPPTWSPDGSMLAFDSADATDGSPERHVRIHVARIDARGGLVEDRTLDFDPRNDEEVGPVWSPEGGRVAFVWVRNERSGVAVGRVDNTDYRELGDDVGPPPANVRSVWMWSPDGEAVLHTYDEGPTWILDPTDGSAGQALFGNGAFSHWQRVER
jgi:Tol biopolymer transport system component